MSNNTDKTRSITVDIDVNKKKLDEAVAKIESAFPKVIFNGSVESVYINYTQNNFLERDEERDEK